MSALKFRKTGFNCGIVLLLAIGIGAILITVANYIPIRPENREESLAQLASEGYFPEVPSTDGGDGSFHSMNPTALELATDNLMIKMALYEGENDGVVQAFRCYSTQYEEEYSRYWHGYVVILRFLLLFFNYYEIRLVNGIFQTLIFAGVMYFILKSKGIKYALALATSYILLMPAALAQCLQYSWTYYITFGALLIYLKFKSYLEEGERYIYFFLLIGIATTYLDLLTYPLLTWGFVIIWWLLMQEKKESVASNLLKVIYSGIAWVTGYAFMWIGKWVAGSLVLRENLFQKAISEAFLWTVAEEEAVITLSDRLNTLYINWEMYSYKLYFIVLIAWVLYAAVRGIVGYGKDSRIPALLLTGFSSIVWYVTLAGHAAMHHIFTHRIYGITIAAFLGIVLISTKGGQRQLPLEKMLGNCLVIMLTGAISVLLMFQLRSDYPVYNYLAIFDKIPVDDRISMNFMPSFSRIKGISIGISTEGVNSGIYRIALLDGEETVYENAVAAHEWSKGNLHELSVDWNLTAGKQYTLQIEPIQTDGNTYLWMTVDGFTPLTEYRETAMGEKSLSGQMLTEITYWCRPVGKYNCLFWITTLTGGLLMLVITWQSCDRKWMPKAGNLLFSREDGEH
ncbi:MAG: hypothetical protein HFH87_09740 [Lachnospiraceae bacterium]|nr:hypothetical protein [Lachnospiraceae bacterium]